MTPTPPIVQAELRDGIVVLKDRTPGEQEELLEVTPPDEGTFAVCCSKLFCLSPFLDTFVPLPWLSDPADASSAKEPSPPKPFEFKVELEDE